MASLEDLGARPAVAVGMSLMGRRRVTVIGGGYAGIAAAVAAVQAGCSVRLLESAGALGGRARSMNWHLPVLGADSDDLWQAETGTTTATQASLIATGAIDHGQHLLVGAYTATRSLVDTVGGLWPAHERFAWVGEAGQRLKAANAPAPWDFALGLLRASAWSWQDRWQLIRASLAMRSSRWRVPVDLSVAAWLQRHGQGPSLVRGFWEPLCWSVLNTQCHEASAQMLLNVLRATLGTGGQAADFVLPAGPLEEVLSRPAEVWLRQQGCDIQLGCWVTHLARSNEDEGSWQITARRGGTSMTVSCDAVVLATPYSVAQTLLSQLAASADFTALRCALTPMTELQSRPIATIWLRTPPPRRVPPDRLMILQAAPNEGRHAQVLVYRGPFDRKFADHLAGHLWAAIISADGPHEAMSREALAQSVIQQVRPHLAISDDAVVDALVVREKRATLACTPGLVRPRTDLGLGSLALAGDYVDYGQPAYPSTLEAAVLSGLAAWRHIHTKSG